MASPTCRSAEATDRQTEDPVSPGPQSRPGAILQVLLAAKAGSGQIPGLSWPPILFLGTKSPAFGRQSRLGANLRVLLAAKAGSGQIPGLSWPPILFLGTKSPAFGRQSRLGANLRVLLAAKAGSGQIPGLSWPPILFLGTKSPAFGRQSRLGGIFLAVLASRIESRFRQTTSWRCRKKGPAVGYRGSRGGRRPRRRPRRSLSEEDHRPRKVTDRPAPAPPEQSRSWPRRCSRRRR